MSIDENSSTTHESINTNELHLTFTAQRDAGLIERMRDRKRNLNRSTTRRHRPKPGKRPPVSGAFAPMLIEMLASPAYNALSLSGIRVLNRLIIENANHASTCNGDLVVTHDAFFDFGVRRNSISAAIRECEVLGFVEITQRGRGGNADFRKANRFRLTFLDPAGATHEWRRITTREEALALVEAVGRRSSKRQAAPSNVTRLRPRAARAAPHQDSR